MSFRRRTQQGRHQRASRRAEHGDPALCAEMAPDDDPSWGILGRDGQDRPEERRGHRPVLVGGPRTQLRCQSNRASFARLGAVVVVTVDHVPLLVTSGRPLTQMDALLSTFHVKVPAPPTSPSISNWRRAILISLARCRSRAQLMTARRGGLLSEALLKSRAASGVDSYPLGIAETSNESVFNATSRASSVISARSWSTTVVPSGNVLTVGCRARARMRRSNLR
jgi:hypothetical protein